MSSKLIRLQKNSDFARVDALQLNARHALNSLEAARHQSIEELHLPTLLNELIRGREKNGAVQAARPVAEPGATEGGATRGARKPKVEFRIDFGQRTAMMAELEKPDATPKARSATLLTAAAKALAPPLRAPEQGWKLRQQAAWNGLGYGWVRVAVRC